MQRITVKRQGGYVLLLMVLAFMGIGGVVLAGFTQQAKEELEDKRYQRNQQALLQAKQALLMFAYHYPTTNDGGPGRLPCPDHNNDGLIDFPLNCASVGRFPFADPRLNTPDIRDATNERLWYAVSDAFDNIAGGGTINSNTTGTITLIDQAGAILYDGAAAGIAAVLIAPGPAINRDEDANPNIYEYAQVRVTATQQSNPRNYLDTFNGFDNSAFNSGESDSNDDGFIIGPVFDQNQGTIVVNDQIMIVTAQEVIAMAEKSVLETYRAALDGYHTSIWGAGNNPLFRHPWLNAYGDIVDLDIYDLQALQARTEGRLPSLNYFSDYDSRSALMNLLIDYNINFNLIDTNDGNDQGYVDAFTGVFPGAQLNITRSSLSFNQVFFGNGANDPDDDEGTLITSIGAGTLLNGVNSFTRTLYFWDGTASSPLDEDGWEVCPVVNGDETDCARDNDAPYNFEPFTNWSDHVTVKIRVMTVQFNLDAEFEVGLNYTLPPVITATTAPSATTNARRQAQMIPLQPRDSHDVDGSIADSIDFVDIALISCEQDNDVNGSYNIPSSNPDINSALCFPALDAAPLVNQFDLTYDFYPELPAWVEENNWQDVVLMSYAPDYSPSGTQDCGVTPPCLTVNQLPDGAAADMAAVLVGSGQIPLLPADLLVMFEGENGTAGDNTFDARPPGGNDIMMVFDDI